ncbi:MAG: 4Fe-4S binding protein [Acidobacteria bacterium]|nr:4Fe-4S binding protein [Acidobacteriota bacterium]
MGHLVGKDVYRALGRKIDGLTLRAPWNDTFHALLKELYSAEEADLVVRMPYRPATIEHLERTTGYPRATLERLLEGLCMKGLIIDAHLGGQYRYIVSPLAVGIFEFTMMRSGEGVDHKACARLFHDYISNGGVWAANLSAGQQLQLMRTVPHEQTVASADHVEVLDYEKAVSIVESQKQFAVGICSCRHEKSHLGLKRCEVPLETCTSLGSGADYLVRRKLARPIDKSEMLDRLSQARDMRLVMNADNVRSHVGFMCLCCRCCCNMLLGVSQFGYPHMLVTSNYLATSDDSTCDGCLKCKKACPINAISIERLAKPAGKKKARPVVDESICLGCGVCALACSTQAMKLRARPQRILYPEATFEKIILQALEVGTLQNLLFAEPERLTHQFLRAFVGAFLRLPPVKKALVGKTLRSRFLGALASGGNGVEARPS